MLKEALQYILDGMRPETQDLCGRAYVITPSGAQEVIETPIVPATLQLHSLDSIVKMIRTEAIHLADANTPALFVNIPSPTNVTCFSQPDFTQRCVRAALRPRSLLFCRCNRCPRMGCKGHAWLRRSSDRAAYTLSGDWRFALCDETGQ